MIRNLVRRVARRVLGRPSPRAEAAAPPDERPAPAPTPPRPTEPAPAAAKPAKPAAAKPAPAPEPEEEGSFEIDSDRMREWIGRDDLVLLDIREPGEVRHGHADGAILIPMNQVPERLAEIPKDKKLVVYCAAGARSYGVTGWLREHGYADSWSLIGGFGALVSAGGTPLVPPREARHPLTARVRVTREPLEADGRPVGARVGTVQAIRGDSGAPRYTVRVVDGDRVVTLTDLAETELESAR